MATRGDKLTMELVFEDKKALQEFQRATSRITQGNKQIADGSRAMSGTFNSGMSSMIKSVTGFIAAYVGIRTVISLTKESIDLFKQQERAVASLNSALDSRGLRQYSKELMEYASSLQAVTTFGDEASLQAQSLFIRFGANVEQTKELTRASLDLATVQGGDLNATAQMLARSVFTSANALSRQGIEIEGAAGSAERYQSALDGLSRFSGAAEAQAKTLSGQMEMLKNAFGDTKELIGETILQLIAGRGEFQNLSSDLVKLNDLFGRFLERSVGLARLSVSFRNLALSIFGTREEAGNAENAFVALDNVLNGISLLIQAVSIGINVVRADWTRLVLGIQRSSEFIVSRLKRVALFQLDILNIVDPTFGIQREILKEAVRDIDSFLSSVRFSMEENSASYENSINRMSDAMKRYYEVRRGLGRVETPRVPFAFPDLNEDGGSVGLGGTSESVSPMEAFRRRLGIPTEAEIKELLDTFELVEDSPILTQMGKANVFGNLIPQFDEVIKKMEAFQLPIEGIFKSTRDEMQALRDSIIMVVDDVVSVQYFREYGRRVSNTIYQSITGAVSGALLGDDMDMILDQFKRKMVNAFVDFGFDYLLGQGGSFMTGTFASLFSLFGGGKAPIKAHTGGIIGQNGLQTFHTGGIVGLSSEERLVKAQVGEAILTKSQQASMSAPRVVNATFHIGVDAAGLFVKAVTDDPSVIINTVAANIADHGALRDSVRGAA